MNMTLYIVVDGDTIPSSLTLSDANIEIIGSTALKGTGHATIGTKGVCLESAVQNQTFSCAYKTLTHTVSGEGTLTIQAVAAQHVSSEEAVMVSEGSVTVDFAVNVPATMPPPESAPDEAGKRSGTVKLTMANDFVTAPSE